MVKRLRLKYSSAHRAWLEWVVFREMAKSVCKTEAVEVVPFLEVVAGIVGCHPVRDRIDIQMHFLRGLRLSNQHLAGWNKPTNKIQFRVVQVKRLPVNIAVHLRVSKKDLRGAALGHNRQHPRFLKLFNGLRR